MKGCLDVDCNSCQQHPMIETDIQEKNDSSTAEWENCNEKTKLDLQDMENEMPKAVKANKDLLQHVSVDANMQRKFDFQLMLDIAEVLAKTCLRDQACIPVDWDDAKNNLVPADRKRQLPAVCCAFSNCSWSLKSDECSKDKFEAGHPWDNAVYKHIFDET